MAWIREGYCCRCGECCVGDPFDDTNRPRLASVEGMCPFFQKLEDGSGLCATHTGIVPPGQEHPYYANNCSVWPSTPEEIADKPSCTYTFKWVEDGN